MKRMLAAQLCVLLMGMSRLSSHAGFERTEILPFDSTERVQGNTSDGHSITPLIRLNFQNTPLKQVLDFLGEHAGIIIVLSAPGDSAITLQTSESVSLEQAIELLDTALEPQGSTASLNGKFLSIRRRDDLKTSGTPVLMGNAPEKIPSTDRMVTQIVPVRFVQVSQLIKDLQPLMATKASMTANESANALVISDTQGHIHRLVQIVRAIDDSAQDFTVVKVIKLRNSNATEMVELIGNLFPEDTRSQSGGNVPQFGGGPNFGPGPGGFGGPPGNFGGPAAAQNGTPGSGGLNQRLKKRGQVVTVADERTGSIVVSAVENVMAQIEATVKELDANPANRQTIQIYDLKNSSPQEMSTVLKEIFAKASSASTSKAGTQSDPLESRLSTQAQQSTGASRSGAGQGTGAGAAGPTFQ